MIYREKKILNDESYSNMDGLPVKRILGVAITDAREKYILEFIVKTVKEKIKPYYVVTPNPEMIVLAHHSSKFREVLNGAKLAMNDGVGVSLAARMLGSSLQKRFTGVDLVERLSKEVSTQPITVGFLGAGQYIAELAAECLSKKYPGLKVAFTGEEWPQVFFDKKEVLSSKYQVLSKDKISEKILNTPYLLLHTPVDILFVAYGAPKQEFWMRDHIGKISVKVMVGVGGAFDQIVHPSLRAPKIIQSLGFGWLYRLIRQPWRIKRQLALLEFTWLVLKERLTLSSRTK